MKLFSHLMLANTRNPLKQGISINLKPERKIIQRVNLTHKLKGKAMQAIIRSV